jgi:glycine hydroxymethyltransferase
VTSGIRLGTPIVTTRGMREPEMKVVGDLICEALAHIPSPQALAALRDRTRAFCGKFPLFAMEKARV